MTSPLLGGLSVSWGKNIILLDFLIFFTEFYNKYQYFSYICKKYLTLNYIVMKQKIYVAPQCEVIEMELQGMIAASDGVGAPTWTPGDLSGGE